MHLVERAKNILVSTGSEWIMWMLIGLSVLSITVIIERALRLWSLRIDVEALRATLRTALRQGGFAKARDAMSAFRHPAAKVVMRGMEQDEGETTSRQAQEAMEAEAIAQRRELERRFNFLATLGANAPFIGLFGTVIGILQAFEQLGRASAAETAAAIAPQAVMGSIAEALVATAIGIGVAIPAVFAYNLFQRTVRSAMDDVQILSLEVMAHLASRHAGGQAQEDIPSRLTSSQSAPRSSRSPLTLGMPA